MDEGPMFWISAIIVGAEHGSVLGILWADMQEKRTIQLIHQEMNAR